MITDGFDLLTYHKGRCRRINERRFIRRRAELDGRWVDYLLHDQARALPQRQAALTASDALVRRAAIRRR